MSLAARFRNRRMDLHLTQTEVANAAGVSQQSIESIESGRTKKPRNLLDLAKALKCSPNWLLNGKNITPISEITRRIPILSSIQAGKLTEPPQFFDQEGDFEYIYTDEDTSETTFALRINGDSMAPVFHTGDVVIIDRDSSPHPGEFVAAKNGHHEATFKKYRPLGIGACANFELIPLNPDYPTLRSTDMPLEIIGVMIEHRSYRRKR